MEDLGLSDATKLVEKQRSHPPKHSYSYMREKRKARRNRNSKNSPFDCSTENMDEKQKNPTNAAPQWTPTLSEKLKLLNHLPAHLIIPPGTNVSVPPPPLPANLHLMRFPLRPLMLKPPPMQGNYLRLHDTNTLDFEKNILRYPESQCLDGFQRYKIQGPPPHISYPIFVQPPTSSVFWGSPNFLYQREFSGIFAEQTLKAALRIPPISSVQLKNY